MMMRLSFALLALATASSDWDADDGLSLLQLRAGSAPATQKVAFDETKGNDMIARATPDGATNIEFVDRGAGPFAEDGILTSASFYVQRGGNLGLRFRIYRPDGNGFSLVGQTEAFDIGGAGAVQQVDFAEPVEYLAGDYVGWGHDGNGNIPFDGNGGRVSWEYNKNNNVGVTRGFGAGGARTYSYQLNTSPLAPPEPPPADDDEAGAEADPHLSGPSMHGDLCCEGGHCKPCAQSLYFAGKMGMGMGKMGMMGMGKMGMMGMGKMGMMGMGKMGMMGMGKMGMMGMGKMGMMGMMGGGGVAPVVDPVVDEEAAAVGDPHITTNTGKHFDLQ